MSSEFGKILRVSVFGQSHGEAIGVLIDGLPAGETIDLDELQRFLNRRRPGGKLSTPRKEADIPRMVSGLVGNVTCGAPLMAVIENQNQRSGDYDALKDTPRPGHADFTAWVKWKGFADMRGGGHFSGRLTAPICVAGGIAKQILARRGIHIGAHLAWVGPEEDAPFPSQPESELFTEIAAKDFPVLDDAAGERMRTVIEQARQDMDSVGGGVECAIAGLPAGLGEPLFDGVESRLAGILFGIPAVKGVEFGAGFHASRMRGSWNNDPFVICEGDNVDSDCVTGEKRIVTRTNHSGGILGGITTGMPVTFRVAFKPTPSIAKAQHTVNLRTGENTELVIHGRHDPCIAHRAVPVVEAVAAAVALDILLEGDHGTF